MNLKYNLHPQVLLRSGLNWGTIAAYDKNNKDTSLQNRNLSFKSNLLEINFCIEVNLLDPVDPVEINAYPYVFAGIGLFHFDPFAYDNSGVKTFLKPLSTEGDGMPEFPDRKEYKLTQICIPFGGGVKFKLSRQLETGFEIGFRKTFTDYLDDVSKPYVDEKILFLHKGPKTVEMASRSINTAGLPQKVAIGDIRGNPRKKDMYYFMGVKLTLKFATGKKERPKKETMRVPKQ